MKYIENDNGKLDIKSARMYTTFCFHFHQINYVVKQSIIIIMQVYGYDNESIKQIKITE